jgi:hypothetical protein
MADQTITATQEGAYEFPIEAGETVKVTVAMHGRANDALQIIAHTGNSPIYARLGNTVAVKDPAASLVMQGSWMDLPFTYATYITVALTSASDATASVVRA